MKKAIISFLIISLLIFAGLFVKNKFYGSNQLLEIAETEVSKLSSNDELKDGDIIFQTSLSNQSKAIQLATNSKYSHCGIIYKSGNDFYVFEAIQPVTTTPLSKWIARGENGKYVIKRLKNAYSVLTPSTLNDMKKVGNEFKGKDYDLTFEWSDDKIYCSELIWKIYKRATGIEVGKLEKLSDFDLTNSAVKSKMNERYGAKIPLNETVISPAAIFDSENLLTVRAN